ncbi:MAG: hypothetical protein PHI97_17730 [Desulfobulbus sp.]|nr:hypothetical protein [Desulfobulbus sp.]
MPENEEKTVTLIESLKSLISLLATGVGIFVIAIGLKYASDIFQLMFSMLHQPDLLADPIQRLAGVIGGSAYDVQLSDRTIPFAKMIALVIYCFGMLTCAFLTMTLMQAGAKIISITVGDGKAARQLLQSVFGKRLQSIREISREERKISTDE